MRVDVKILKGYQVYLNEDGLFCINLNNGLTVSRQSYLGICNVISGIGEEARQPRKAILISGSYEGSIHRVIVIRQGEKFNDVRLESNGRYCKMKGELYENDDNSITELTSIWSKMESEKVRLQTQIDTNYKEAMRRQKEIVAKLKPL